MKTGIVNQTSNLVYFYFVRVFSDDSYLDEYLKLKQIYAHIEIKEGSLVEGSPLCCLVNAVLRRDYF
jgi:hypothetical protein